MSMSTRGRVLAAFSGLVAGSIAALAILFALVLISVQPAYSADLHGACCADLEERVAELEATVARKGNRKVTVVVYGQVNKALLWHDAFTGLGGKSARGVVDNTNSPTMLGVMGEAKISPSWTAGYRIELGINEQPAILILDNQVSVRRSEAWLNGPVGKFTVGRTSMATDGVGEVTVANTLVASKLLSLEPMSSNVLFGIDLPYDGPRRNAVKYESPAMAGFIIAASWSSGPGDTLLGAPLATFNDKDVYDIAVRYAGEFGGFRLAAAAGWRKENYFVPLIPLPFPTLVAGRDSVIVASGSVMHMASGLFANVAGGWAKDEFAPNSGVNHNTYHVQAGWEKNVNGLGATTLYGEYGRFDANVMSANPTMMGAGAVQRIDAAAMDLYASYRRYDMDNGGDKINVFMSGVRVQF